MTGMQLGIIVTIGIIGFNLLIFSLIPLGIKKLVKEMKSKG